MVNIQLNNNLQSRLVFIGTEQLPVLVIEQLIAQPEQLLDLACANHLGQQAYQQQLTDYYPGLRKAAPSAYIAQLSQLLPLLKSSFARPQATQARVVMSAFSIATTPPEQLRPIQMLPHFDSPAVNQFAVVHYLCDPAHGGTAFYRHKSSGFECITADRLAIYRKQIKQQAIAEKLHLQPKYMTGDSPLFSRLHSVPAKMNRAVIYPSNALHSGDIKPEMGLLSEPRKGRLTMSSFIRLE